MPRYFFHVRDNVYARDDEGLDLPDLAAARKGAVHAAREMMCETLKHGRIVLHYTIDIADQHGVVLDTVVFGDVVEIEASLTGSKLTFARFAQA